MALKFAQMMQAAAMVSVMVMTTAHAQDAGGAHAEPVVFDGYDAFYTSLGPTVFAASDERPYAKSGVGGPSGDFWRWRSGGKAHVMELRGADIVLDGRRLAARKATIFDGEDVAPALGTGATVYANDQHLCVQGVPPSASGTAARHMRVSLVLDAFTPRARRIELPSLFASCLGVFAAQDDSVRFFRNLYRWEGAGNPQGVEFEEIALRGIKFAPTGRKLQGDFVEDGNVYRFTAP